MHSNKTIGIDLWSGQQRGGCDNNQRTRISTVPRLPHRALAELFCGAYERFAGACREIDEPGLAIVAIDEQTGEAAGLLRLRARIGRHVTAIVGRHDRCDLYLAAHAELALRHLAVIVDPVASFARGATCSYRILDLRTTTGFGDEHGRPLGGVRCDGAAILRCAGYALFVVPLGEPTDWPVAAADAWSGLPERVYLDELPRLAQGSRADILPRRSTQITRVRAPHDTRGLLVTAGDVAGTLVLQGPTSKLEVPVGDAALRDGVLIGRYDRCHAGEGDDESLSRVHALVIQLGTTLLVIDTASTFGTSLAGGAPARVIELGDRAELELATETRLGWCRVS